MTKKTVFLTGLIGIIVAYVLTNSLKFGFCRDTYTFGGSVGCLDKLAPMLGLAIGLFAVALFILSIITYKMQEEVFRAWLHFAYWWIPVSLVFIYLAGGWSGGGFGIPNVLDQESVSIIFSGLFTLISLILIAWKYFSTRRG